MSTNVLAMAAVLLLAVLVGVAIPVLLQLRQTLKTLQTVLAKTGRRLDEALDEITDAAQRVNSLGKELEEGATRLRLLFDVAGDIGKGLTKVRNAVSTASLAAGAVAPAVSAAVKALWQSTGKEERGGDGDPATRTEHHHPGDRS
jgi:uncharacterized protein YoxC